MNKKTQTFKYKEPISLKMSISIWKLKKFFILNKSFPQIQMALHSTFPTKTTTSHRVSHRFVEKYWAKKMESQKEIKKMNLKIWK